MYQSTNPRFDSAGKFNPFGWDAGNDPGAIYQLTEADLDRVGNCWMRGRLHAGDLVLCLCHTGDCFFDYCLIELYDNGLRAVLESRFGSYCFRDSPIDWQPSEAEFADLIASKSILTKDMRRHPIWSALK